MEGRKLEIIKELMNELAEEMEYSPDDFHRMLGKEKPEAGVTIMEVSGKESPMMEKAEETLGMDLDDDAEMGESSRHRDMVMSGGGEDDDLREKIMRLRG